MDRISYLTLLIFILLYSCDNPQRNKNSLTTKESTQDSLELSKDKVKIEAELDTKNTKLDTLDIAIGKPQIIAFTITQSEYNKLSDEEAGEYDEGYGDFIFYIGKFAEKVKGNELLISETASRFIRIKDSLIDRQKLKSTWGLIFITKDGKYEVVCDGLLDSEILEKSKSMFSLHF